MRRFKRTQDEMADCFVGGAVLSAVPEEAEFADDEPDTLPFPSTVSAAPDPLLIHLRRRESVVRKSADSRNGLK